ncbi:MAG: hypothetical protein ACLQVM_27860 [Terriglobia bacterium]
MKTKADDQMVDDPNEAMRKFQSALSKLVKVPKTITRAKHKHTTGRQKITRKKR